MCRGVFEGGTLGGKVSVRTEIEQTYLIIRGTKWKVAGGGGREHLWGALRGTPLQFWGKNPIDVRAKEEEKQGDLFQGKKVMHRRGGKNGRGVNFAGDQEMTRKGSI